MINIRTPSSKICILFIGGIDSEYSVYLDISPSGWEIVDHVSGEGIQGCTQ